MSRRERKQNQNKFKKSKDTNLEKDYDDKDFDKTTVFNRKSFDEDYEDDDYDEDYEKSNSTLKKVIMVLTALVILIPVGAFAYFYNKLNTMFDDTSIDNTTIDTTLSDTSYKAEEKITNILLVGTDARPGEDVSRSDAMMILTIDGKNKALKITSLNRDTYVDIPGHGKEKLTHAYAYGEIDLLIKTIEENFKLDIQNYAVVNFLSFMDIIDTLGGVEVNVKQSEINETNKFIKNETYKWSKSSEPMKLIEKAGVQKLNGYQALSFARIRHNDSTMERDRRQSEVIAGVIQGLKNLPVSRYPALLDTILPYVKTNMKASQIISLGTQSLGLLSGGVSQLEFPLPNQSTGVNLGSTGYVVKFPESSLDTLHKFIFENIKPVQ